ncbi:MAG TPA: protein kinase [Myxococcota bacterium]|nr:protein kinase [Myxococcota bacterium]
MRALLGRGGMATVLEVEDTRDGSIRALKLLHSELADEEVQARFDVEFRTLSALESPNILRVYEAGVHDGLPWFTMDKLDGHDLRREVDGWRDLPPSERFTRAESILADVADALAYIHERGLVHRDVTPGNVMIVDGRGMLTDFGVVHTPGAELTTVGEMVGTVSYIAPEQISSEVNGGKVDSRADLYALGGVLYLMLTGRRPFTATTIPSLLEKQLHAAPRPPRDVAPTVPAHLDEICLRLLEKDPAQRYGSARHLLSILDRRAAALEHVDLRHWPPRLVGRTGELSVLREALSALAASRGGAVLVEAPSGFGKARLLEAVLDQARELGLPVARGRCTPGETWTGFRGVLEDLAPPELPAALSVAFSDAEGEISQYQVHAAFRDLLRAELPRVVVLDKLERADRGTLALLDFLARNHLFLADDPVLFILARRALETTDSDPLGELLEDGLIERVPLLPISVTAVEELLLQLIPADSRARTLAQRLHREGEGNLHFIGEMIHGLVDQGVITEEAPGRYVLGLEISHVSRARLPIPSSIREALEERLSALRPAALQVAEALALCRHEVALEVLEEALSLPEERVLALLEELLDHHVVRTRVVGLDELYDLAQARLRDVLVQRADPLRARQLHRRLGCALERLYRHQLSTVLESIAFHFEQGEVPAKAYPYLVQAGRRLQERSFVIESKEFYERALSLEPEAREFMTLESADRQLAELRLVTGQVEFHLGDWTRAEEEVRAADALAREIDDDRLRTRTLAELGTLARRQGRVDQAEACLKEALLLATTLGEPRLRMAPLLGLAGVRWSHGDLGGARQIWLEAMVAANAARSDVNRARALNGLGLVALCRGQAADARRHLEEAADVFGRLGKLSPLVVARVNLVELYHCTGNLRKGLKLADRTISQAREIRYTYGVALGLQYRSMILVDVGRLAEAEENATEAMRIISTFEASEDELAILASHVRIALGRGDLGIASQRVEEGIARLQSHDVEGYAPLFYAWRARCLARDGDLEAVLEAIARADAEAGRHWPHQECRLDIIAARALGAVGDAQGAVERASRALKRADGCGYRFYSLKAHGLIATYATDESTLAMHRRVARALSKSLASNLSRDDSVAFSELHGIE